MKAWLAAILLALSEGPRARVEGLASDDKKSVPVVCPVDGAKFTAIEIIHTNQLGGRDYDFCPHAFKTTPLEFYVWVCPSCSFAGLKKDFAAPLSDDEKKALREGLKPLEPIRKGARQADIPGHVKYDLLAQVLQFRKAKPDEVARAWLHASWVCRQRGAVYLDGFDEWEALRDGYSLNQEPIKLAKKNRTDFELEVARKIEKEIGEKRHARGVNRILARYLLAYLHRKHGENPDAERWLAELDGLKGENSVVDDAAARMRASIALERGFQKKAIEIYAASPDPTGEIAYVLGELCRRTGDSASASTWYKKAIDTSPSDALKKLASDQSAKLR